MILLLIGVLAAQAAQSPVVIVPGAALRARCASPAADSFRLTISRAGQPDQVVGTMHRTRALSREAGEGSCLIVQRYLRPGAADVDSSFVNGSTLAPIRYTARVGTELQLFRFAGDGASGTMQRGDSAPTQVAHPATGPFFLAVTDLEVIAALPLAAGYEAQFAAYNPPRGYHTTRIRVEGVDTLTADGGCAIAWRLSYDSGASPTLMWFCQRDHQFLHSQTTLRNGAVFWRRRIAPSQAGRPANRS